MMFPRVLAQQFTGVRFTSDPNFFKIYGQLAIGEDKIISDIIMRVQRRGMHSPIVVCTNTWLLRGGGKHNPDWHVNSDGSLCYVIEPLWQLFWKKVSKSQLPNYEKFKAISEYTINSLVWLLDKHLIGCQQNLSEWPGWPQWSHGRAGYEEYKAQMTELDRQIVVTMKT